MPLKCICQKSFNFTSPLLKNELVRHFDDREKNSSPYCILDREKSVVVREQRVVDAVVDTIGQCAE